MQFFRSYILALALIVGGVLCPVAVEASNLHLIVGADYLNSDIKYNSHKNSDGLPKDDYKSVVPVIGLSAYGVGLEAFILGSDSIKEDSLEAKLKAYGIAFFGEANLSDNFSLIASLGLAEYKFTTKTDNIKKTEESNGPRFGIGLQYYLTRNIAIRGMYHYTLLNSGENDCYDAVSEFSAGLRFIF